MRNLVLVEQRREVSGSFGVLARARQSRQHKHPADQARDGDGGDADRVTRQVRTTLRDDQIESDGETQNPDEEPANVQAPAGPAPVTAPRSIEHAESEG